MVTLVERIFVYVVITFLATAVCPAGRTADVVKKTKPGVVYICAYPKAREGSVQKGSGFIMDKKGLIVTNHHVISDAERIEVTTFSGEIFSRAELVYSDEEKDFALIEVKSSELIPLSLGDSDKVAPGDEVITIGHPRDLLFNVTYGIISGRQQYGDVKMLQTDVSISPGNSGGPLLDMNGSVIGIITSSRSDGQNLNCALPINYIRDLDRKHLSKYYVNRASVDFDDRTPRRAKSLIRWPDQKLKLYFDGRSWNVKKFDKGNQYSHCIEDTQHKVTVLVEIINDQSSADTLRTKICQTLAENSQDNYFKLLNEQDGLVNTLRVKRLDIQVQSAINDTVVLIRYRIQIYKENSSAIVIYAYTRDSYYFNYQQRISDLLSGLIRD